MISSADISPDTVSIPGSHGHIGPERKCVGTGKSALKSEMVRFVKGPDNNLVPDIAEKLPGRGVYTLAERYAVDKAIKTGGFKRGLKANVQVNEALTDQVEMLLRRRVLSLMTMALKGGNAYIGFDQVKSAAQSEPLAWRIEARDGSSGGRSKIRVLTRAVSRELQFTPPDVVGCFTTSELGKAFGRDELVHAAIKKGRMAKSFDLAVRRLSGFTDLVPSDWEDFSHENKEKSFRKDGDKG